MNELNQQTAMRLLVECLPYIQDCATLSEFDQEYAEELANKIAKFLSKPQGKVSCGKWVVCSEEQYNKGSDVIKGDRSHDELLVALANAEHERDIERSRADKATATCILWRDMFNNGESKLRAIWGKEEPTWAYGEAWGGMRFAELSSDPSCYILKNPDAARDLFKATSEGLGAAALRAAQRDKI